MPKTSENNKYDVKTIDNVLIAFAIGLFGGPISALSSSLMLYLLRKRKAGDMWKTWFLVGIVAMPITNLIAQAMFKWDVNSFAIVQSIGKYKTYRDWTKAENEQRKKKKAEEKAAKNAAIKSHPSYSAYEDVFVNGVCVNLKYYGHLKPTSSYFNEKRLRWEFGVLDREEKWDRNPKYDNVCFKPFLSNEKRRQSISGIDLVNAVNKEFDRSREYYAKPFVVLRAAIDPNQILGGSVFFSCPSGQLLRNKWGETTNRNGNPMTSHTIGRFHEFARKSHAKKMCANPSLKKIFERPITLG